MHDEVRPGRVLGGRYRLERELARGGMASVWVAQDPLLSRRVAVKVLLPALAVDDALRTRFRHEAVAAAKLTHPGIVATYDTGDDDGTAYIVMELVDGTTLRRLLDERARLPVGQSVDIAAQVADALEHAHRQGIVHRDVKPANVLVQPDGRVKVTDFGIAKAAGIDDLTKTGTVIGTARYLAPEQVNGQPIDARTDVYALGLVLYEMLAGKLPFGGDTEVATAVARLTTGPEPVRSLRPEVSRPLEEVVARSLARDPQYRFPSAHAFRDALHPGRANAPTGQLAASRPPPRSAPSPGPPANRTARTRIPAAPLPARATRPPRRRRIWPLVLLLLVLIAAAVAAGYYLVQRRDTGSTTGTTAPASVHELPLVAAKDFDPLGDGSEHPGETRNAIDGDPKTVWHTDTYANRNFGNAKPGVGLWVQLDASHKIASVTVSTLENGWSAQIYVADQPGTSLLAWGQPRASGTNLSAIRAFPLDGVRGQYVLIWCTGLPPSDLLQIADVKVAGR